MAEEPPPPTDTTSPSPPLVPLVGGFTGFEAREPRMLSSGSSLSVSPDGPPVFVARLDNAPPALRDQLAERGWMEYNEEDPPDVWHLFWKCGRFRPSDYEGMTATMKINHIPKSHHITRKDMLMRNLRKFKSVHGAVYNFFPEGYLLPSEYTKFVKRYSAQETKGIWICKPADMSRGRKIFLIRDIGDLSYDQPYIIQRYIERPLLVGGYKLDLRLYVLVASVFPLRAYLYREGLVRFGTEKYTHDSDLGNLFSHLTNSSINKFSGTYGADKEVIGAGCKWTLEQLWAALLNGDSAEGTDERAALNLPITEKKIQRLWARIRTLIMSTLLILPCNCPVTSSSFELLGFDVLIDSTFKPWIVEVNLSPALSVDCDTDVGIKVPLMGDTLDALQYHAHEMRQRELAKRRQRADAIRTKSLAATRSRQRMARTGSSSSMSKRAAAEGGSTSASTDGPGGAGAASRGRGGRASSARGRGGSARGRGRGRGSSGSGSGSGGGGSDVGRPGRVIRGRPTESPSSAGASSKPRLPKIGSASSMSSTSSAASSVSGTNRVVTRKSGLPPLGPDDPSPTSSASAGAGTGVEPTPPAKPPPGAKPPRPDPKAPESEPGPEVDTEARAYGPFGGAFPGKLGRFERLFPFSDETEALADQLTTAAVEKATPVVQQDILRKIVAAVRAADRPTKPATATPKPSTSAKK